MYQFLALISGIIIAIMVTINGGLTTVYGVYTATVLIHIVGVISAFIMLKISKQNPFPKVKLPFWLYTGGAVGMLTPLFLNFSFGKISITAMVALSLFAQMMVSLIFDVFGLLGLKKTPIQKNNLPGIIFAIVGISIMMIGGESGTIIAVLLALGSGVSIVIARMINAQLAEYITDLSGSFINHWVGLQTIFLAFLIFGFSEIQDINLQEIVKLPLWTYLGGTLGVIVVLLCNKITLKLPAFQLTLLTFIGQIFTGIIIDLILKNTYSIQTFYGTLIVSIGLSINIALQSFSKREH